MSLAKFLMGTSSSSAGGDGGSYPQLIFDYLGISERGACANTCRALQDLIFLPRHSKDTGGRWKMSIWTSLDLIGTRRPAATLKAALALSVVNEAVQHLNLEFCRDVGNEELTDAMTTLSSGLESLNLNALYKVTGDGVREAALQHAATLKRLSLYCHQTMPDAVVVDVATACTGLRALNLAGCRQLEDSGVRAIARHCRGLTDLDLTRCSLLSANALSFIGPRLSQLRRLNLYADSQIQAEGFFGIAELSELVFLDMCGAAQATPEAIAAIAAGCPSLEHWNLSWCVQLNNSVGTAIARHCTRLSWVSFFGITGVTDVLIAALATPGRCGTRLQALDVHGTGVRRQKLAELREAFPRLKYHILQS